MCITCLYRRTPYFGSCGRLSWLNCHVNIVSLLTITQYHSNRVVTAVSDGGGGGAGNMSCTERQTIARYVTVISRYLYPSTVQYAIIASGPTHSFSYRVYGKLARCLSNNSVTSEANHVTCKTLTRGSWVYKSPLKL